MLIKFSSGKIKGAKNALFFFRELQLVTVLRFICDSCMSWNTRFVSLKMGVGFSFFNSFPFLLKLWFLFNKMCGPWFSKFPFKIKIVEKPHTLYPRPLIFQLEQEVLKLNDICVSWSPPKTDIETNFLNLEKWSFENVSFSNSHFKINVWHSFT